MARWKDHGVVNSVGANSEFFVFKHNTLPITYHIPSLLNQNTERVEPHIAQLFTSSSQLLLPVLFPAQPARVAPATEAATTMLMLNDVKSQLLGELPDWCALHR